MAAFRQRRLDDLDMRNLAGTPVAEHVLRNRVTVTHPEDATDDDIDAMVDGIRHYLENSLRSGFYYPCYTDTDNEVQTIGFEHWQEMADFIATFNGTKLPELVDELSEQEREEDAIAAEATEFFNSLSRA